MHWKRYGPPELKVTFPHCVFLCPQNNYFSQMAELIYEWNNFPPLPAGKTICHTTRPVVHLGPLTVKCTWATWAMVLPRESWSERSVITAHWGAFGWPGTLLVLPLWSLKIPEMQKMLWKAWMESECNILVIILAAYMKTVARVTGVFGLAYWSVFSSGFFVVPVFA